MTSAVDIGSPSGDTGPRPSFVTGAGSQPLKGRILGHLALAQALSGDLAAACASAARATDAAGGAKEPDGLAAAELALAWVCLLRADDRGAERHADAAAALGPCSSAVPVLALVRGEVSRLRAAPSAAPSPHRAMLLAIDPLTARELEVLHHLDALLPTEEIAGAMYVSVNTVKTHVRAILRKLSVERRYDAVRRARQIGLL